MRRWRADEPLAQEFESPRPIIGANKTMKKEKYE